MTASLAAAAAPVTVPARRAIAIWLNVVAAMIVLTLAVGGATRLTDSGLSITEWKPVVGVVPPLSEAAWEAELDKYRAIPEYQLINKGMSLEEFKRIYWWEWGHRISGRLIGLVFAVPLAVFWLRGDLTGPLKRRLVLLLALGGLQGAVGWWMVASGLVDRVDVSHYRLAVHLTLACLLLVLTVWTAREVAATDRAGRAAVPAALRRGSLALLVLVLVQIALGALVAGLDAGLASNSWPLINGALVPPGLISAEPWWMNLFENPLTVQFDHRVFAYLLLAFAGWHALAARRRMPGSATARRAVALAALLVAQAALGVMVVIWAVPPPVALAHQVTAAILVWVATVHAFEARRGTRPAARAATA